MLDNTALMTLFCFLGSKCFSVKMVKSSNECSKCYYFNHFVITNINHLDEVYRKKNTPDFRNYHTGKYPSISSGDRFDTFNSPNIYFLITLLNLCYETFVYRLFC